MNNTKESLKEEQLLKIILYFYHKKVGLRSELTEKSEIDEFVNIAYQFFLDRDLLNKYDSNKGTFSTYVMYVLNLHYKIFVNMVKYNISFTRARALVVLARSLNKNKTTYNVNGIEIDNEYFQAINFNQPLSLNQPLNGDIVDTEDTDACMIDLVIDDSLIANVQKYVEIKNDVDSIYFYLEKTRVFSKREKEIIRSYLQCNCNEASAAKKLKLTRSRVNAVVVKFKKYIKKKIYTP